MGFKSLGTDTGTEGGRGLGSSKRSLVLSAVEDDGADFFLLSFLSLLLLLDGLAELERAASNPLVSTIPFLELDDDFCLDFSSELL